MIVGGSGGAAIAPDGTPTLFGPGTMTPANRSDPELLLWNQSFSKPFNQGPHGWSPEANAGIWMPLNEPGGVWDTSVYKEPWPASPAGFRYRTSSGSCTMAHGRLRANASGKPNA